MPDKADTKILQVLRRQTRQNRVVDLILAECRLILFEAKPPQPTSDVHGGAPVRTALHDSPRRDSLSRVALVEWPVWVKLRNTQHEQMSSALAPRPDVGLARQDCRRQLGKSRFAPVRNVTRWEQDSRLSVGWG